MITMWKKLGGIGLFAMSLVLWSCSDLQEGPLAPGQADEMLLTYETSSGYTVARETDPSVGVVTATIDEAGGALSIGKHLLHIPAGAVSGATVFTMSKAPGDIKVSLSATSTRMGALPNDVGAKGFQKPLKLSLHYGSSFNDTKARDARIIWLKPLGGTETQATSLDTQGKWVIGSITHFSDYAIGFPN